MISFRSIAKIMDFEFPPDRLGGNSIPWLQANNSVNWLKNGKALEFVSNCPNGAEIGLVHKQNKGLFEMHRWPPSADGSARRSFRKIAERHQLQPAWTFKFLWFNTWLLRGPIGIGTKPFVEERCKEIAHEIARNDYHVVGLCEVFSKSERDTIRQIIGEGHRFDWARGPEHTFQQSSGLMTLGIDKVNIRNHKGKVFEEEGGGWDSWAEKGILYTELELCPLNSDMRPAIDLFITHLHAEEADTRSKQVKELVEFIRANRKQNNLVIVAGDFNISNLDQNEYPNLLQEMAVLDLYDIWLTRGGFSGGTNLSEDPKDNPDYTLVCPFDANSANPSCQDYSYAADADPDSVPGKRLDYVFIEAPKDSHSIIADIPRVRRKPFWRGPSIEVDGKILSINNTKFWTTYEGDKVPNFMSDHLGIEIDLLVSPCMK